MVRWNTCWGIRTQISVEVRTVRHVLPNQTQLYPSRSHPTALVASFHLSPRLAPQDLWSPPPHHSLSPSLKDDVSHNSHQGRYNVDRSENSAVPNKASSSAFAPLRKFHSQFIHFSVLLSRFNPQELRPSYLQVRSFFRRTIGFPLISSWL